METAALTAIRFGLDVTVKTTLLLALALCLVAALSRASSALRHLAAMLGLAGALALPVASVVAPRIQVPMVASLLPAVPSAASLAPAVCAIESKARAGAAAAPVWPSWVLAIWAAGALLALLRLFTASLRIRAIARDSEPLSDPEWLEEAADVARRLSLETRVQILANAEVPVAMTAGVRRPVLLVSSSARHWAADLRRVVLLHELAHVRRRDWITLSLCEIAVGIYWFHPLVWLARREIRRHCERACDDMVIGDGTKPSVYAAHLLGIVRSLASGARVALPATAIADRSQFEGRMRAILNPAVPRRRPSGGQIRAAAAGLFACVLALGALEPTAPRVAPATVRAQPAAVAKELPVSVATVDMKRRQESSSVRPAAKKVCRKKASRLSRPRTGALRRGGREAFSDDGGKTWETNWINTLERQK